MNGNDKAFYPEQAAQEAKRRREAGEAPARPPNAGVPAHEDDLNRRVEVDSAYLANFARGDGINRVPEQVVPQSAYDEAGRQESKYAAGIRQMAEAEAAYEQAMDELDAKADADAQRKRGGRTLRPQGSG